MSELYSDKLLSRPVISHRKNTAKDALVEVIIDIILWISRNDSEHPRIQDITERSGFTHWYFQRQFSEMTGCTLSKYIRARKLSLALKSLIFTRTPLIYIASDSGFSSQQTFTRVMTKEIGKSPSSLRMKFSGKESEYSRIMREILPSEGWFRFENLDENLVPKNYSGTGS